VKFVLSNRKKVTSGEKTGFSELKFAGVPSAAALTRVTAPLARSFT